MLFDSILFVHIFCMPKLSSVSSCLCREHRYAVDLLTGGNVQMHDKLARANRTSLNLGRSSSSTQITQQPLLPRNYRPHAPRATTWCCGSFVVRQLRKTQHLEWATQQYLFSYFRKMNSLLDREKNFFDNIW